MNKPKIEKFKSAKQWIFGGQKVYINKIETRSHIVDIHKFDGREVPVYEIPPSEAVENIIRNVALLPNASFIEKDAMHVLARITDLAGSTLIITEWTIDVHTFNGAVSHITYGKDISAELFHVVSKMG